MVRTFGLVYMQINDIHQLIFGAGAAHGPHGTTASDCPLPGLPTTDSTPIYQEEEECMCSVTIHQPLGPGHEYAECIKFHTPTVTPAGFFPHLL